MVSLKQKRQSGFTIVELLIVIIIIGILAGLVVTQILGANAKARDTERKTDLDSLSNQLEAYYAKTGGYPTLTDLTDATWRTGNEFTTGDNAKALYDPMFTSTAPTATVENTAMTGPYTYATAPGSCVSPTKADGTANTGTFCSTYTLTALLENTKDASAPAVTNGVTQYQYIKKSANQ